MLREMSARRDSKSVSILALRMIHQQRRSLLHVRVSSMLSSHLMRG
jgi:hypothetical protein